jgi:undecaprenyl diphosphate synthase
VVEELTSSCWNDDMSDVDFVIRTGGEPHWSAGFMMWLTANSQFYFTETLWPDFKTDKLKTAIENFESRERRLGK